MGYVSLHPSYDFGPEPDTTVIQPAGLCAASHADRLCGSLSD